jgi:tetratricopeptide (TPR) repeat protein
MLFIGEPKMIAKFPRLNSILKHSGILMLSIFLLLSFFIETDLVFSQKKAQEVDPKILSKFKKAGKFYKKGKAGYSKGDKNKAEKNLKKCLEIYPEYANANYYLSKMAFQEGNLLGALDNIEKAKKDYQNFVAMNKAVFRKNLKEFSENVQDLKMEGGRGSVSSRTGQRDAMKESRKHMSKAQENYNNYSASINIILADYYYMHGSILYKQRQIPETIEQFIQTIKLNPKHNLVYTNLASIYYMSKQYNEALEIIKQGEANGVEINPKLKEALKDKTD